MRRKLVAGNWKMNGSRASIRELLDGVKAGVGELANADIAVCAPFIYLDITARQLDDSVIAWGAQDVSQHLSGAYTGDVSVSMLKDFACTYVIVGHSERRAFHAESDEVIAAKYIAAHAGGVKPILCIGETLEEREKGVTEDVVGCQLDAVFEAGGVSALKDGVIAYEPVWAIGTGRTATPEQAQEIHRFIRQRVAALDEGVASSVQILYGGSMNAGNAAGLLAQPDIDGGLIGGASLKATDFLTICQAASG